MKCTSSHFYEPSDFDLGAEQGCHVMVL